MELKIKIQADFITAMKAKDEVAKTALSGIKAKITEAEKANGNKELSDDEIVKVLSKAIKQREESYKIFEDAGRSDMAHKEASEAAVLRNYMPSQMTPQEIGNALTEIMQSFAGVITNPMALQGKTIGEFNKRYNGRADIGTVKEILTKLIEA